jgi:hypothetical protein
LSRQVSSPSHGLLGDFVRIPGNQLRRAFRTLRGGFAIGEIMYVNVAGRLLPIPGSSGIDNSKRVESIPWRASRGTSASQIAGATLETQEHDSVRRAASPSQRGGTHFRCFSGKSSVLWSNPSDAQVQKQLAVVVTLIGQKRGSRRSPAMSCNGTSEPSRRASRIISDKGINATRDRPQIKFARISASMASQAPRRLLGVVLKERYQSTCAKHYSYLSATMGSTRIARRAGI